MFLYARQILLMVIALYTSRVILQTLGADDYGIYNVVGGFVAMFNVLSGAFTVAISRFIAYVLGEDDDKKLREVFSTALVVQSVMGLVIVLLLSTVGVWYVRNVMVLPEGRMSAALWVMAFSAITFFIDLIAVPYNALIVAHEHMKAYAYIAIFEGLMKLAISFVIVISPFDKLISYGFLMLVTAVTVRFCYTRYCRKHFANCKFHMEVHRHILKEMMTFVGWAFLGNGAVVLRDQGTNMLLNLFGGTTVNAARGIAQSVNSAVQSFANNFMSATQPEITKLRATNQLPEMQKLILRSCRISYFLMLIMSVPLIKNIDYVLLIWLGEVPEYTNVFVIYTLVDSMLVAIDNPLLYGLLATGEIKNYEIFMSSICVLTLPLNYVLLSLGMVPTNVYLVIVGVRFLILLSLVCSGKRYGLKKMDFVKEVASRILVVTAACAGFAYLVEFSFVPVAFLRFLLETVVIVAFSAPVILFLGFTAKERRKLLDTAKRKLMKGR